MSRASRRLLIAVCLLICAPRLVTAEDVPVHDFVRVVQPLLVKYCHACHNARESNGELNLAAFPTADALAADPERLESIRESVAEGFMPPAEARPQPTLAERQVITEFVRERLRRLAQAQAGDPGEVGVRRLTNAELNYTLADLTGLSRDWTKDFPRDGSGGEGFSNTGQTLQMSAAQIEKYLALAQRLVDHALLLPGSGPVFLETPVRTLPEAEPARLTLERLDQFCRSHRLTYHDSTPRRQLTSYAYPDQKANPQEGFGHLRGYKPFSSETPGATLSFVGSTHRLFYRTERLNPTPLSFMIHRGTLTRPNGKELTDDEQQTWERLWLDFRFASSFARPAKISILHRWFSHQPYRLGDQPEFEASLKRWKVGNGESPDGYRRFSLDPAIDLSFTVLSLAELLRPIRPIPPETLRDFTNIQQSADGESRTLMIPNHDAFDAFLQQALTDEQLEALWRMTCDPASPLALRLGGVPSVNDQAEWLAWTEQQRRWQESTLPAAQQALLRLAARAWRRPLTEVERAALAGQIEQGMNQGQSLTEAMQLPLVRVFLSPHFLYRIEQGEVTIEQHGRLLRPLNDFELASRLSYFLWSSLPDQPLWEAAEQGTLTNPERLVAETHRMLQDAKIRRFSREMFGQWLGFYRFAEFDRPDGDRFPEFDVELRQAMDAEALDFCTDLAANDRDIRLLLNADYGFLSRRLAEHYGVNAPEQADPWEAWTKSGGDPTGRVSAPRVSLAGTGRRGVLGWGAVLTVTSHPLRTSPVLRGQWVLDDLLGIPTPPPPAAVPELPKDEKNDQGLSIAQLLAQHRQDKACAVCHDRIDPLGLALEGFDPIGRRRERDLNGQPVQTRATLHDGTGIANAADLVEYLQQERPRRLFVARTCRKMLGYALGRSTIPGDEPLLESLDDRLAAQGYRFSVIVEAIVTSPQFRHLRGNDPQENVLP